LQGCQELRTGEGAADGSYDDPEGERYDRNAYGGHRPGGSRYSTVGFPMAAKDSGRRGRTSALERIDLGKR